MNANWRLAALLGPTLFLLAGCDPNPNGPAAPTGIGPGKARPADTKGKAPLRDVGPPIGAYGPSPAWSRG